MSKNLPVAALSRGIFRGMPAPLLGLISVTLAVALGADLLLPDVLPLLDEAVLAFLLYGSTSSFLARGRGRDTRSVTEAAPVSHLMKEAALAARELESVAGSLRQGGLPVKALDALEGLGTGTSLLIDELRSADAFLSRKENDPWQVQREMDHLERAVAEAETSGEGDRQSSLQIALEGARMHSRRVAKQSADRDRIVSVLRARAGQFQRLTAILQLVGEGGDIPVLPDDLGTDWEPELRGVIDGLREVAVAAAELDAASHAGAGNVQGRRRSSNTA